MPEAERSVLKIPQQPNIHITLGQGPDSFDSPGQHYTSSFRHTVSTRDNRLPDSVATKINHVLMIVLCCQN
jgi:hypothetical protein